MFGFGMRHSDDHGSYGSVNNRGFRDSSRSHYGYSARNYHSAGCNYSRNSAEGNRAHPAAQNDDTYSFNMAGWPTAVNSRQTSQNLTAESDAISKENKTTTQSFQTFADYDNDVEDGSLLGGESDEEFFCKVCNHHCLDLNAYVNHINSLQHIQRMIEIDESKMSLGHAIDLAPNGTSLAQEMLCDTSGSGNVACDTEAAGAVACGGSTTSSVQDVPAGACDSANKYYCEVCCCAMTGPKAYECHVSGSRHKRNLKNRAEGRPIKKGRSGKSNPLQYECGKLAAGQALIMPILNNIREPLIGLQFVTEYQMSDRNAEPHYVCTLCDSTCDPRTLVPHLIGFKHRLNYMEEHYASYYSTVKQKYQKRSEQILLAEEYARTIECEEGRQEVKVIHEAENNSEDYSKPVTDNNPDRTAQACGKRKSSCTDSKSKRACGSSLSSGSSLSRQHDSSCHSKDGINHCSSEPSMRIDENLEEFSQNVRWQNGEHCGWTNSSKLQSNDKGSAGCHGDDRNAWNSNQKDWADSHCEAGSTVRDEHDIRQAGYVERGVNSKDSTARATNEHHQTTPGIRKFLEEMANCVVKSEEDAEMALQVSNTLTKALMNYRMKDLSRKLREQSYE